MEMQVTILIKNKVRGLNTPDFKTHCKPTIIETISTDIKTDI